MFTFQTVLVVYFGVLTAIGIPGNTLVVVAYGTKAKKTSTDVLILGLACTDLVFCLWNPMWILFWVTVNHHDNLRLCRAVMCFSFTVVHVSVFVTSAIAFDRYFAVCRPLQRSLRTPRKALASLVGCSLLAGAVTIPIFPSVKQMHHAAILNGNTTTCWVSPETRTELAFYVLALLSYCLSFFVVTILYARIYAAIRRRAKVGPRRGVQASTSCGQSADNNNVSRDGGGPSEYVGNEVEVFKLRGQSNVAATSLFSPQAQGPSHSVDAQPVPETPKNLQMLDLDQDSLEITAEYRNRLDTRETETQHMKTPNFPTDEKLGTTSFAATTSISHGAVLPANQPGPQPVHYRDRLKNRTTIMLTVVAVVTYVTWVPTLAAQAMLDQMGIASFMGGTDDATESAFWIARNAFALNHIANPLIYGVMNRSFRKDCLRILRHLRPRFR